MKINLKDIKKGQEFFEFKNNKNCKMLALEDARAVHTHRVGHACKVQFTFCGSVEKIELFQMDGGELDLFDEPQSK